MTFHVDPKDRKTTVIAKCRVCAQKNRFPVYAEDPKCGRCKTPLYLEDAQIA